MESYPYPVKEGQWCAFQALTRVALSLRYVSYELTTSSLDQCRLQCCHYSHIKSKTSQFKMVCKDNCGYITQLIQQKSRRWYYSAWYHNRVNVLTNKKNSNCELFHINVCCFINKTSKIMTSNRFQNMLPWLYTVTEISHDGLKFWQSGSILGHLFTYYDYECTEMAVLPLVKILTSLFNVASTISL